MKRFFGTDSALFKFMTILLELAELNLLFILCSVPVVTMGAAYAAMLGCLYEMQTYGEGCLSAGHFFKVFKRSLKPLIPAWCITLLCSLALILNMRYVLSSFDGAARILLCGAYIVLLLIVSGMMQYLSFFAAMTENWNREYLKNSFLLALARFPVILLTTVMSGSIFLVLLMPGAFLLRLLPLILLFWFSCPAHVCVSLHTHALKPLFPEMFGKEQQEE